MTDAEKVCDPDLLQAPYVLPRQKEDAHYLPVYQRFVLAEMIKVSHIDVGTLVEFAKHHNLDPNWMQMQLPSGTCHNA